MKLVLRLLLSNRTGKDQALANQVQAWSAGQVAIEEAESRPLDSTWLISWGTASDTPLGLHQALSGPQTIFKKRGDCSSPTGLVLKPRLLQDHAGARSLPFHAPPGAFGTGHIRHEPGGGLRQFCTNIQPAAWSIAFTAGSAQRIHSCPTPLQAPGQEFTP